MENIRTYGVTIKLIRQVFGYSQDVLAEKTGVSPQAISQYENDITPPNINFVKSLFFKLNVNPLWFFLDFGDVIIDTSFQLGSDFIEIMRKIRRNSAIKLLVQRAIELDNDDTPEWYDLVGSIKQILFNQIKAREEIKAIRHEEGKKARKEKEAKADSEGK